MTGAGTAAEVASVSLDGRLFVIAGDVDAAAVRMAAHNAALAAQAGLTHDRIDIGARRAAASVVGLNGRRREQPLPRARREPNPTSLTAIP